MCDCSKRNFVCLNNCKRVIVLFIYFLDYLLTHLDLYAFFSIWIIVVGMSVVVLQRVSCSYGCEMIIILYPIYWLIYFLLEQMYVSFLFIWIIVERMFMADLQEIISFYCCEMIIILYPVHWLIQYLLRSVCCFFSLALF